MIINGLPILTYTRYGWKCSNEDASGLRNNKTNVIITYGRNRTDAFNKWKEAVTKFNSKKVPINTNARKQW